MSVYALYANYVFVYFRMKFIHIFLFLNFAAKLAFGMAFGHIPGNYHTKVVPHIPGNYHTKVVPHIPGMYLIFKLIDF